MNPDFDHLSQFDREELDRLGQAIQRACSHHGKKMSRKGVGNDVALATFNLGVAISNFSKLNGQMSVWATFTPTLFDPEEGENVRSIRDEQ